MKSKLTAKLATLKSWGSDPDVVAAVKSYNATPPPEAKAMNQEKWKSLTLLDPYVRSFTKNSLAVHLKSKLDPSLSEVFVSGADGGKVAFLTKTSNWSHKGKEKHDQPMQGKTWMGAIEVDDSTGAQQVQVSFPVLDGAKPIGSITVGVRANSLK